MRHLMVLSPPIGNSLGDETVFPVRGVRSWVPVTRQAHLLKLYVIFSATSRSPMSNVGNMDSEGMKRGSAMNLHQPSRKRRVCYLFCA